MISKEAVLEALKNVQDPDLHKDIVTLGFVKDLEIRKNSVRFTVELTTPACPVKEELKQQCIDEVKKLDGVDKVEVEMTAAVRTAGAQTARQNLIPGVRNVVAVASGKGGVGKSTVAVNLAIALAAKGARVGLLDADIYGPSIPMMMGSNQKPASKDGKTIEPVENHGIKMISIGFLIPTDQALVWRGPMVGQAVNQLLRDVNWGELDYMVVDMPPGTGDAQLTLSQSVELVGAVIVSTPQDVALLDARRGVVMFQKVNVPILGIVENMSYFQCPKCGERTNVFGTGGVRKTCETFDVPFLGEIPLHIGIREAGDAGTPITAADPDSHNAAAFKDIAGRLASNISILQHGDDRAKMDKIGQKLFFANKKLNVLND